MPEKRVVFEGKHFRIYQEEVDVGAGALKTFEYVWRRDGTRVIALDADDRVLLTREYRFELRDYDWRLPGGKLDSETEPPETAAAREFEEETGYKASRLEYLSTTTPFATIHYRIHFFLTREPIPGNRSLEAGENIEMQWTPFEKTIEMALFGEIKEDISAMALVRLANRHRREGKG